MKKGLSLLLIVSLCVSMCVCTGSAADAGYPESAHNYADNSEERWNYTYPGPAENLYITFSEDTFFAPERIITTVTRDDPPEVRQAILEYGYYQATAGDWLHIYYGSGELYRSVTADDLAGRTIRLPGNSFTLVLESDAQDTEYGFSIDRISPDPPDGFVEVRYHMPDGMGYDTAAVDEPISLSRQYKMRQVGDQIVVGWKTADGRAWYYDNVEDPDADDRMWGYEDQTDLIAEPDGAYDLYPITCKIGMTKDEVFSFLNASDVFDNSYRYTRSHYLHMFTDWIVTFGWTPLFPIMILVNAFLTMIWPTIEFDGSCCGFPITELLQHYGKIDLLSRQGAGSVSELQPDEELLSQINFYNNQAVPCHLVNHTAIERGTQAYSEQLRALYETLESGTPVYFEFYPGTCHPIRAILTGRARSIFSGVHGILMTGAYTDGEGNHILITCDCNSYAYSSGTCDIVYINADFTDVYYDWFGALDGFSWNETVAQFASFPAEGLANPFAWHIQFFKNGFSALRQVFALLSHIRRTK